MLRRLLLAVIIVVSSSVTTGEYRPSKSLPIRHSWFKKAVVNTNTGCSGVCVHPRGIILTVKHCWPPINTKVHFFSAGWVSAQRVYIGDKSETPVVLLCKKRKRPYPYIPLSKVVPQTGRMRVAGRPGVYEERVGRFLSSYLSEYWGDIQINHVKITTRPGMSGGPLIQNGKVVGLTSTYDGTNNTSDFITWKDVYEAYQKVLKEHAIPEIPEILVSSL